MYKSLSLIICSVLLVAVTFDKPANATYTKCRNPDLSINRYCFKRGDRGIYIQKLTIVLGELGYYQGKSKNLFDKELEKSVIKFQEEYRLKSTDGIVGNETLLRICQAIGKGCPANASQGCYTGSPRNVVACLNNFKSESEKDRSYSNGR
jgi:peptidoglycan hydrolase-like protein with peptidoglycan-binding domain